MAKFQIIISGDGQVPNAKFNPPIECG